MDIGFTRRKGKQKYKYLIFNFKKMKKYFFILLFVVFSLVIFGCSAQNNTVNTEKNINQEVSDISKEVISSSEYEGAVLAGTSDTLYLDFNKEDYEKALNEKKKILLYFYANWCPICRVEQLSTFAAFNEINDPDLIGFRVNYRDSDTDESEENLAKEFGISYQHTKIILKDKERVLKAPDSWNKERYLEELSKI